MGKIITHCPSCESRQVQVSKIQCADCSTTFEGHFDLPGLLKLSDDDLQFIIDFVKCSGSLKEMAQKQDISYPTIRNRLNTLINLLEGLETPRETAEAEILQLLEEGKISVQVATALLQKL